MVLERGIGVTNNNMDSVKIFKAPFRVGEIQEDCFASELSPTTETWTGC